MGTYGKALASAVPHMHAVDADGSTSVLSQGGAVHHDAVCQLPFCSSLDHMLQPVSAVVPPIRGGGHLAGGKGGRIGRGRSNRIWNVTCGGV